uniref:Uncharacterized protein n=1 Tax=Arundo donax TaxID=35708 RepID=A0A0A9H395_ARUDO
MQALVGYPAEIRWKHARNTCYHLQCLHTVLHNCHHLQFSSTRQSKDIIMHQAIVDVV